MPVDIAVIGLGHMGRIHLKKLMEIERANPVCLIDKDEGLLDELSKSYDINTCRDYTDLPYNIRGAVIATPTESHFEIAEALLKRGVNIFIEKPITKGLSEAERLIDLATKTGLILQVGHIERFNPAFKRAIQWIKRPLYIEARRISGFTGRSNDIDVVLDLMIHDVDLILSIIPKDIIEIKAIGTPLVTEKIDVANATIYFEDGSTANLTASRVAPTRQRSLTIIEKDRAIYIDLLNAKLSVGLKDGSGELIYTEYQAEDIDPVKEEMVEFINAIEGKTVPVVSGKDGLNALRLVNKIKEAIG
jgi:predicted dehydrogenase